MFIINNNNNIDLRLQLLEPEKYPALFKCLYGLLMFLPQSSAFATLRNRLTSVSSMVTLNFNETVNQLIQTNLMISQSLSSSPLNQKISSASLTSSQSSPNIYATHDSPGSSSSSLFGGKRYLIFLNIIYIIIIIIYFL